MLFSYQVMSSWWAIFKNVEHKFLYKWYLLPTINKQLKLWCLKLKILQPSGLRIYNNLHTGFAKPQCTVLLRSSIEGNTRQVNMFLQYWVLKADQENWCRENLQEKNETQTSWANSVVGNYFNIFSFIWWSLLVQLFWRVGHKLNWKDIQSMPGIVGEVLSFQVPSPKMLNGSSSLSFSRAIPAGMPLWMLLFMALYGSFETLVTFPFNFSGQKQLEKRSQTKT